MKQQIPLPVPEQTQRRKAERTPRSTSLVRAQSRALKTVRSGLAPLRLFGKFLLLTLALGIVITGASSARAQGPEDTIRVRTRVVFLDALVKEKRTGMPISDLKPENFQVFDDGKERPISYFTREGQARKPLALVIILDCRDDGAGRFLKRPEVLKAMADELAKLPAEDEVAIMAMNINGEDEKRLWLSDFTRDRAQLAAALARVPAFVDVPPEVADARAAKAKEKQKEKEAAGAEAKQAEQKGKGSLTINADTEAKPPDAAAPDKPKSEDVIETETIKGKNGAVVVRTIKKDGSVSVKRTSANGHTVIEIDDIYDMAAAVRDASRRAEETRPNSQTSVVWVSDGIAPIFFEDRDATEQLLIRSNVIFSSLTVDLQTIFKFLMPIGKPIAGWMGVSLYGSAKRLAQKSGGEAVRVNRVSDYGSGLAKIIGNLTARYSLGFTLAEEEKDDGRMHELDVRVKAPDAKGKTRKLLVSARQGYYMPTTIPEKDTTAEKRSTPTTNN
jgi:VWFA-related protein